MSTKQTFWLWLLASGMLMGILNWLSAPMVNEFAPWGLFSWQLAATPERAQTILNAWDERTRYLAAFGLGLDYLFLFVYAVTLSAACRWSGQTLARVGLGNWIGGLVWAAAMLDGVENTCLGISLIGGAVSPYPQVAFWSAAIKFGLIFLAFGWIAVGMAFFIGRRLKTKSNR